MKAFKSFLRRNKSTTSLPEEKQNINLGGTFTSLRKTKSQVKISPLSSPERSPERTPESSPREIIYSDLNLIPSSGIATIVKVLNGNAVKLLIDEDIFIVQLCLDEDPLLSYNISDKDVKKREKALFAHLMLQKFFKHYGKKVFFKKYMNGVNLIVSDSFKRNMNVAGWMVTRRYATIDNIEKLNFSFEQDVIIMTPGCEKPALIHTMKKTHSVFIELRSKGAKL